MLMDLARQQGLLDVNMIGDSDRQLLRLMMPVAKMFCGKKVVANASECIECFGGQVSKDISVYSWQKIIGTICSVLSKMGTFQMVFC